MAAFVVVNRKTLRIICSDGAKHKNYSESVLGLDASRLKLYSLRHEAQKMADRFNDEWLAGTDPKEVGRYEVIELKNLGDMR
jgi:hypothetical protein